MNKKLFTHCGPDAFLNAKYRPIFVITGRKKDSFNVTIEEAVEITNVYPLYRGKFHITHDASLCYMEKCKECKYALRLILGKCKTSVFYIQHMGS